MGHRLLTPGLKNTSWEELGFQKHEDSTYSVNVKEMPTHWAENILNGIRFPCSQIPPVPMDQAASDAFGMILLAEVTQE